MWAGQLPKDQLTLLTSSTIWRVLLTQASLCNVSLSVYAGTPGVCVNQSSSGQYIFVAMRYVVLVLFWLNSPILVSAVCCFICWEQMRGNGHFGCLLHFHWICRSTFLRDLHAVCYCQLVTLLFLPIEVYVALDCCRVIKKTFYVGHSYSSSLRRRSQWRDVLLWRKWVPTASCGLLC